MAETSAPPGTSETGEMAAYLKANWARPPIEGRRTKIICTIGPKTQSPEMLGELITAGMNVARMNFSHGSHEYHAATIENVRKICSDTKRVCSILLDTKGPEIRTGKLVDGKEVELESGQLFTLYMDTSKIGDRTGVAVDYANLPKVIPVGYHVLIDDGLIGLRVIECGEDYVLTEVVNSGTLGEKKGVNLPGVAVDLPAVTEKDVEDILFGVEQGVDFIAASFVRKASDVEEIRQLLGHRGQRIQIISKIESQEGLDNFDEILAVSDGIMVARGDLGVEIPIEKVGLAQKAMIHKCNMVGKPVITATQMLESMIVNPRPTRAEASDVTNAVLDGSDCVMLSGETAKGKYPIDAVRTMSNICLSAELAYDYRGAFNLVRKHISTRVKKLTVVEALTASAVSTANDLGAGLIITLTETGNTARLVAKYRPRAPIFCITSHKEVARQLLVSRGVFPVVVGTLVGVDNVIARVIEMAKQKGVVGVGDFVVVSSGMKSGPSGLSNLMKVMTVE